MRKKAGSLFLTVMMAAVLMLTMASCGKKPGQTHSKNTLPTLEEYFVPAAIAELEQQMETDRMDATARAEGDTMFINLYSKDQAVPVIQWESLKPKMNDMIDKAEEVYTSVVKKLQDSCSNENITLQLTYTDSLGTDIFLVTYSASGEISREFPIESMQAPEDSGLTLEEYFETDEMKATIAGMQKNSASQKAPMDLAAYAMGNAAFFDYTLRTEVPADSVEEMRSLMSDLIEQKRGTLEGIVADFKSKCSNEEITLWVTYMDFSGTELATASFSASGEAEETSLPTLEEYVASGMAKTDMQKLDSEEASVNVYAKGDTVFFDYTLKYEVPADSQEEVKAKMAALLETQRDTMEKTAADLKNRCSNESVTIRVTWVDSAGNELAEASFSAGDQAPQDDGEPLDERGEALAAFIDAMIEKLRQDAAGGQVSLEEYLRLDSTQDLILAVSQQFVDEEHGGYISNGSVKGDTLTLTYSLVEEIPDEKRDEVRESLIAALDQREASLNELAKQFKAHCTNEQVELWFNCVDSAGEGLCQKLCVAE